MWNKLRLRRQIVNIPNDKHCSSSFCVSLGGAIWSIAVKFWTKAKFCVFWSLVCLCMSFCRPYTLKTSGVVWVEIRCESLSDIWAIRISHIMNSYREYLMPEVVKILVAMSMLLIKLSTTDIEIKNTQKIIFCLNTLSSRWTSDHYCEK